MTSQRESEIETLAINTLQEVGETQFPIDVMQVANAVGIAIYDAHFQNSSITGAIQKSVDGGKIWVNQFDSPIRQRFAIAHEIGHWLLHMHAGDAWSEPRNLIDVEMLEWQPHTNWNGSEQEREANQFAAALLMPLPWLDTIRLARPSWNNASLASFCGASLLAMEMRTHRMERTELYE